MFTKFSIKKIFLLGFFILALGCGFGFSNKAEAATNVYYSVGQNTTDHKTGSPTLTIASGVGTFSVAQTATNMGVGDKVTYNTTSVCYISSKTSTSVWNLITATGTTCPDVTGATVNSIAHPFASLNAAVGGFVANNATSTNYMNTSNLVTGDFILNIPVYYDSAADTATVRIRGYTTGANNYIRIYAATSTTSEVNQSQRHSGLWSATKYALSTSGAGISPIRIDNEYVRLEGLQVKQTASSGFPVTIDLEVNNASSDIRISNSIIVGNFSGTTNTIKGIGDSSGFAQNVKIWNNIFYGFSPVASTAFAINLNGGTWSIYNNTFFNNGTGLNRGGGTAIAKNNLIASTTTGFSGTFSTASTNNSNSGSTFASSTTDRVNQTFSFVNTTAGTEDFHLLSSDTGALNHGATLSSDANLPFSNDIDGQTRAGTWDIGADEYIDTTPPTLNTYSPADDATGVAIDSNLVLTFSENVAKGTGNILIKNTAGDATVQTIDVTSGAVSIADNIVTINPSDLSYNTGYYVTMASGVLTDTAPSPNAYAGISDKTIWNFTTLANPDTTAPVISAFVIPSTYDSLTVPITTFTATDDSGTVSGYMATTTSTAPSAGDSTWQGTAPTSYVFSTEGSHTLYAWAKDSSGNVSTSLNGTVVITLPTYSVGGTISGLSGTVVLQNNSGNNYSTSTNGTFAFTTELHEGDTYAVTVSSQPNGQTCTVSNGSGTVGSSDVTNVSVSCTNSIYWVSPTGAATWANCKSDTPLAGAAACSRATANTNASAGDTIYFRGGTYTVAGSGLDFNGIGPTNSGTSPTNRITFARYASEVPVITGGALTYGIYLSGNSYIKVDGFTFQDIATWAYIIKSSSYNEITNSTFVSTPGNEVGGGLTISGTLSCAGLNCWNTHNWIHDNTFSKRITSPCGEGVNIFTIGNAYGAGNTVNNDNYNTIENNTIAYSAHGGIENNSMYTVIRNNIFHNEPWISGCTNYQGGTSVTSLTISTSNQTLTVSDIGTLSLTVNAPIGIIYASDYSKAMSGIVQSYNSGTGQLVVRNVVTSGSGTYSNWILSQKNVPFYDNPAYNGLYGHRNIQLGDDYARDSTHVLLEGNRIGNAGNNPGNGGSSNLDLAAPKNIVRYNDIFNGMASGIYFKYADSTLWPGGVCTGVRTGHNGACGGMYNRVYNNTVYHNGYGDNWRIYGNMNNAYNGEGIAQWDLNGTGPTGNVIKNNIVYDNKEGDICQLGLYSTPCTSKTWDTIVNNWTTANGDPKFTNADLSDATSATLPNLSLQSDSGALNGGTYLTQTNGTGSNSTTLVVDDAMYFQDGTWGSDLARGVDFFPDWIAIGTVNNVVQISSINYDTNTITLASPMTWSDNANIWLYKKSDGTRVLYGSAPDFGASESSTVLSSAKAISVFNFASPSVTGSINEGAKTITLTVPFGTDVTALVPTITTTGVSISPNTGVAQNFSSPVTYTVTAEDSTTQPYTATVTFASNTATSITSFDFVSPAVTGTVDNTAHTVALTVPYGTSVTSLTPTIVLATGATISPNTGVATNFISPVTYTVTAQDGSTNQNYTVTVSVGSAPVVTSSGGGGNGPILSSGGGHRQNISTIFAPTTTPCTTSTSSIILTRNLSRGSQGNDVTTLQNFLVSKNFLTSDSITGYFGIVTETAVKKFQKSQGIVSSGTPTTTGFGNVGTKTRARIISLGSTTVCTQTQNTTTPSSVTHNFVRDLSLNMAGEDVRNLQKYLNINGFVISQIGVGSPGKESTLFGMMTYKALMKFQKSAGLPATGFFGPMTREYVNKK